jgi:hypothetical protein
LVSQHTLHVIVTEGGAPEADIDGLADAELVLRAIDGDVTKLEASGGGVLHNSGLLV